MFDRLFLNLINEQDCVGFQEVDDKVSNFHIWLIFNIFQTESDAKVSAEESRVFLGISEGSLYQRPGNLIISYFIRPTSTLCFQNSS